MFGIFFSNHPDLRRILSDYSFQGYPLKKDFPLSGFVEVSYNTADSRLVFKEVKLSQEYRSFHYKGPLKEEVTQKFLMIGCLLSNSYPSVGTLRNPWSYVPQGYVAQPDDTIYFCGILAGLLIQVLIN
jgi:hypothetical protein